MNKKIEIEIPEGKVAEWKVINGATTLVLTDEKDNRPVTERIKTFEDAMIIFIRLSASSLLSHQGYGSSFAIFSHRHHQCFFTSG